MDQDKPYMEPLEQEEVRNRRHYFLTESKSRNKIYRGDKRVHGDRICAICHTSLSTMILATGETMATRDHHRCYFSSLVAVSICLDSRVCQKVHKELREKRK